MSPRIITPIVLLAGLVATVMLLRRNEPEYLRISGAAQGTSYRIIWESQDGQSIQPDIDSLLSELDHSLSTYRQDSLISRINRNDPDAQTDRHLRAVLEIAKRVHRDTRGAFDPTIAPLVLASGFGPDPVSHIDVDPQAIEDAMELVGLDKITIADGRITKPHHGVRLDLNGIGQGYAVDLISSHLQDRDITNFMVELGGEVLARGVNAEGGEWRIGIDRPSEGNTFPGAQLEAVIRLRDRGLATSGNYRNFHEIDGRKFTHVIDPRTGAATTSPLLSVTVTAPNATLADAYATACMVMGLEKGTTFINSRDDLEALFIHSDESGAMQTRASAGLQLSGP